MMDFPILISMYYNHLLPSLPVCDSIVVINLDAPLDYCITTLISPHVLYSCDNKLNLDAPVDYCITTLISPHVVYVYLTICTTNILCHVHHMYKRNSPSGERSDFPT